MMINKKIGEKIVSTAFVYLLCRSFWYDFMELGIIFICNFFFSFRRKFKYNLNFFLPWIRCSMLLCVRTLMMTNVTWKICAQSVFVACCVSDRCLIVGFHLNKQETIMETNSEMYAETPDMDFGENVAEQETPDIDFSEIDLHQNPDTDADTVNKSSERFTAEDSDIDDLDEPDQYVEEEDDSEGAKQDSSNKSDHSESGLNKENKINCTKIPWSD